MIAGIDEAGRGCVIGPLIICAVVCLDDRMLRSIRVKDSKLLTPSRRATLEKKIREHCSVLVENVSAAEINRYMKKKISLNEVEAVHMAELIKRMNNVNTVYIDCPDVLVHMFSARLARYLKPEVLDNMDIVIEHKADVNHPVVSAASIVAKEVREREIAEIKKKMGIDFGSGYTSDPITIEFLKEHVNDPILKPYLRTLWKTVHNLRDENLQTKLPLE